MWADFLFTYARLQNLLKFLSHHRTTVGHNTFSVIAERLRAKIPVVCTRAEPPYDHGFFVNNTVRVSTGVH